MLLLLLFVCLFVIRMKGGLLSVTHVFMWFSVSQTIALYTLHTGVSGSVFLSPSLPSVPRTVFSHWPEHQNTHGMGGDGNLASKNYSTWSQAMMDNLAASTHPSYFKTSHSVASKAVFYSRGTRLSTPFWARHNDMLALLSNHFCLCIMQLAFNKGKRRPCLVGRDETRELTLCYEVTKTRLLCVQK